jgi:enoyl-CoA hydratase/carnithine racemase
MDYRDILFDLQEGVATITLNQPDKLNAMSWASWREFQDALGRVNEDDDVKVLMVTGAGRGFCSGTDVTAAAATASPQSAGRPEGKSRGQKLRSPYLVTHDVLACQKPTIAAINGTAAGAGFAVLLGFDIRIASEKARFSTVFVRRGLSPDFGCTYLLPRVVGMSKALELMYSGDLIDADEALRIGLVSQVLPEEELLPTALDLAARIARGPSLALEVTKRLTYRAMCPDLEEHTQFEEYLSRICQTSEDVIEGMRSFLEKRQPQFKGR